MTYYDQLHALYESIIIERCYERNLYFSEGFKGHLTPSQRRIAKKDLWWEYYISRRFREDACFTAEG